MKRFLSILWVCMIFAVLPATAKVNYEKEAQKEAKAAVKKLEKEKWKFSGVGSFENSYARYLLRTKDFGGDCEAKVKQADGQKTIINGEAFATTLAQQEYAQENEATLIAEAKAHTGEENIHISDALVKSLGQFNGDITRQFSLVRKNSDGTVDVQCYFLVDVDGTRAKLRKLAQTLDSDKELGDKIRKSALGEE